MARLRRVSAMARLLCLSGDIYEYQYTIGKNWPFAMVATTIKERARSIISVITTKHNYPLVVASCGRSGSSMLFRYISRSCLRSPFRNDYIAKMVRKEVHDLKNENIKDNIVYKTHDYPTRQLKNKKARVVYTYDEPSTVLSSVINKTNKEGKKWLKQHAENMNGKYTKRRDLFEEDSLGIQDNYLAWEKYEGCKVMMVKYSDIWKRKKEISKFIGFQLYLPTKKERSSSTDNMTNLEKEKIARTFRSMKQKV